MGKSMTTGWCLWGTHMTSRTPPSLICWLDDCCRGENHRTTNIQWGFSSKPCPVNPESIWSEPSSKFVWSEHSVCGGSKKNIMCLYWFMKFGRQVISSREQMRMNTTQMRWSSNCIYQRMCLLYNIISIYYYY